MTDQKFLKIIAQNLKSARARAGLRQADVEEKIGLTLRHYQSIEAGKVNVTALTLLHLASLFKVKPEELLRAP